ncbi:zinc finger CCCH domain-containing protein 11A isoform X2 [Erpetoichthys calabaricus]|uniref:Zinc finger CCCH-type containing 11A n=1 Tax=Erpetoichthys calabaricus TaxID=27687 RepID=A0A8C4X5I2_ERPCA|nr:zinc finger CCCH domain-containing protein 11A isoform X2 [Erpetoichthys calabaricus]
MSNQGNDCYFYYYSTCTKGDSCPFRHCSAALGSETVCTLWQEERCFRKVCKFRHMEIEKKRSEIPCYWEKQSAGCQKVNCAFHHEKPRIINGQFLPASKAHLKKEVEEEEQQPPQTAVQSSASANPPNPQLRGVMKAENSENVPSPTHPPVVINPVDDDEDDDDQFSEEGEEGKTGVESSDDPPNSLQFISARSIGNSKQDSTFNFGIKTLEELRLKKAVTQSQKKTGDGLDSLNSGHEKHQAAMEKANLRTVCLSSSFTKEEGILPVKCTIAQRLSKRKAEIDGDGVVIKKVFPAETEIVPKRSLMERLGRKLEPLEDGTVSKKGPSSRSIKDRLGIPAYERTTETDNGSPAKTKGDIHVKTLEEILLEKATKSLGSGSRNRFAQASSGVDEILGRKTQNSSNNNRVKTFSEMLHAKKHRKEHSKIVGSSQAELMASNSESESESSSPQTEFIEKGSLCTEEVRIKTLEEIRKEKAARLQASTVGGNAEKIVTREDQKTQPIIKRRILRIGKTIVPMKSGKNVQQCENMTSGQITEPVSSIYENVSSSVDKVQVKSFEEIMREKRLRKSQEISGREETTPGKKDIVPLSCVQRCEMQEAETTPIPVMKSDALLSATNTANDTVSGPIKRRRLDPVLLKQNQKTKDPLEVPHVNLKKLSSSKNPESPELQLASVQNREKSNLASLEIDNGTSKDQDTPQRITQMEMLKAVASECKPKVRPKLNVKPSVMNPPPVRLSQKRKSLESQPSAIAAVKPLNSAASSMENKGSSSCIVQASGSSVSSEDHQIMVIKAQLGEPQQKISPLQIAHTETVKIASKEPGVPESPCSQKSASQMKTRRQSSASSRVSVGAGGPVDDFEEFIKEFSDDPLEDEIELDAAEGEDDLLLELSKIINS